MPEAKSERLPVSNAQGRIQQKVENYLDSEKANNTEKKRAPISVQKEKIKISFETIEEQWVNILRAVKEKRMSIGVFLSEAEPIDIEGDSLIAGFPSELQFHKETLESMDNRKLVEDVMSEIIGARMRISYVVTEKDAKEEVVENQMPEEDHHSAIVEKAMNMFRGKTIRRIQ